jgi:hypothetical protein
MSSGLRIQTHPSSGATESVSTIALLDPVVLLTLPSWNRQICACVSMSSSTYPFSSSFLSRSNVIEDVTARVGLQEDAGICFAYYNYRDAQLGDVSQILAALIKQLCRKKDRIPHDLLQVKHDALPSSLVGTYDRFVPLLGNLSKVYVVFDALDECPEEKRKDIIGFITAIVTAPGSCCVKIFVTSRKEMDITKAFEDSRIPTIPIQADNVASDIKSFARNQVETLRRGEHGNMLYVTSDDLREKIIRTLAAKADGM